MIYKFIKEHLCGQLQMQSKFFNHILSTRTLAAMLKTATYLYMAAVQENCKIL